MDRRLRCRIVVVLGFVTLLLVSSTAPGLASGQPIVEDQTISLDGASSTVSTAVTSDGRTIHRTLGLQLTPETPGEIAATATFDIPDDVRSLETTVPKDATVTSTRGFSQSDGSTYIWDENTDSPRIRFTVPANETRGGVRAAQQSSGYSFVDTGSWALVSVPQLSSRWKYVGDRVILGKSVVVDGEGATGDEIAFLGPHRVIERTAHGQQFTFIVPDAATLQSDSGEILDSITAASDTLRVGARDSHVFMVAAPTTVTWEAAGIEYGGSDYWVKADERLDDPRNVWLHEYVHTRQDYEYEPGARWTIEAGAEYYAALLTLQQDRIGFGAFQRHLDHGTRDSVRSDILADPSTWSSGTPYLKGALVYGTVDRRIRIDSNTIHSMQTVLSRMNVHAEPVTADEFYATVGSAGATETRTYAERYAGTSDVPSAWTLQEHEDAFSGLPARVSQSVTDLRIVGEHRNTTLTDEMTVTTGESVRATIEVMNSGGADSTYETTMFANDNVVASTTGDIAADATTSVALRHQFDTPGTYEVLVAGTTRTLHVEPPVEPQVGELTVNASSDGGQWTATISLTMTNPANRAASGSVPITVDGTAVANVEVTLAPSESTTRTITTAISPGTHTVSAGNATASIDIPTPTSTQTTETATPGFSSTLFGIVLLSVLIGRTVLE